MKKLVSLFLALILALAVLAVPAAAESMIPMTIKYGVLSMLNASEEQMINYYLAIWQLARQGQDTSPVSIAQTKRAAMPKNVCVYYDSLEPW